MIKVVLKLTILKCLSKPIPGYEGIYEAHSDGTIWSCKGKTTFRVVNGRKEKRVWQPKQLHPKIQKRKNSNNFSARVDLWKNGKHRTFLVHRLIATAFIENPNNLPCINHKDGNSLHNNPKNLEWCTYKYNQIDAFKNRLNKHAHPVKLQRKNKTLNFYSLADASRFLGRNNGYVSDSLRQCHKYILDSQGVKYLAIQGDD